MTKLKTNELKKKSGISLKPELISPTYNLLNSKLRFNQETQCLINLILRDEFNIYIYIYIYIYISSLKSFQGKKK
jgi:hypothetical protein